LRTFIARSVEKPSLRTASCCSVEVVNGGAARTQLALLLDIGDPRQALGMGLEKPVTCAFLSALPTENWSSFSPWKCVSLAVKGVFAFSASKWTDSTRAS